MPQSFLLPLAGVGLAGAEFTLIIVVSGLLFGGIMAIAGMYFKHQRERLWHDTARIALEKGQPIPSGLEPSTDHLPSHDQMRHHDVRGGFVLIAAGLGLYLFLLHFAPGSAPGLAFVGAIPGFIGIALLLHAALTALFRSKKSESTPPRS